MDKEFFNKNVYLQISLTKLVILSIHRIILNNEECAYERVVKECFELFPKRFCFQRYPQWPDGCRVKIEILRCRDSGWITGNEKTGYQITSLGKRVAQEVLSELQGIKIKKQYKTQPRDRGTTIINNLKKSLPFKRFQENKENFNISEEEFRNLLVATFETPPRVLKQNFNYYVGICRQYGETELLEFLRECEKWQGVLLKSYDKGRKNMI